MDHTLKIFDSDLFGLRTYSDLDFGDLKVYGGGGGGGAYDYSVNLSPNLDFGDLKVYGGGGGGGGVL